jgi:hypothetical protein
LLLTVGIFKFAFASGDAKLALTRVSIVWTAETAPMDESRRCSWAKDSRISGGLSSHEYHEFDEMR